MELQVEKVIPQEKGRAKVLFDNGMEVTLYRGEMRKLELKEGCIVPESVYQQIMVEILGKRAIKRAMHLLERQERTEKQLYDKLRLNNYPEECIEGAIQYVKNYHYVDDMRYARTYIRFHQEKKSRQKLKMDLMVKGVPKDTIEIALDEEYESDDRQKILELLQKKHFSQTESDEGERRRIYQFLLRRGFRSNDILHMMKSDT